MGKEPKLPTEITSDFAILDVKKGRAALAKYINSNVRSGVRQLRVPVTITGFITDIWGNDDGESREFTLDVTNVKMGDPE